MFAFISIGLLMLSLHVIAAMFLWSNLSLSLNFSYEIEALINVVLK